MIDLIVEPSLAFLGSIIGGAASIAGGLLGNKASAKQASQGQAHSDYQLQNRHQWEAEDLRKAGRNPILYSGSTPSAGSSPIAQQRNPLDGASASAIAGLQAEKLSAELDLLRSQSVQAQTQGVKNLADAKTQGNIENISRPIANLASSAHKVTKQIGSDISDVASGAYNSAKSAVKYVTDPFRPSWWKKNFMKGK